MSTGYMFAVIENDKPRFVRLEMQTPNGINWNYKTVLESVAWVSGRRVADKQVVKLEKGRHPLMIQFTMGKTDSWGKIWLAPRFVDVSESIEKKRAEAVAIAKWWPEYKVSMKDLFVLK